MLGFIRVDSSDLYVALVMLIMSAGMGLAMTPATNTMMGTLPEAQFGVGSGVNSTTREVGGALGVAVLGSLFAGSYAASMSEVTAMLPPDIAAIVSDSLAGAVAIAEQVGGAIGAQLLAFARQAFVDVMAWASVIGTVVALASALIALVGLPGRDSGRTSEAAPASQVGGTRDTFVARQS